MDKKEDVRLNAARALMNIHELNPCDKTEEVYHNAIKPAVIALKKSMNSANWRFREYAS